jgi:oligoendopeptidase F
MWAWKPHYYYPKRSFYNYPYAFGLLFGTGLYAIYSQRGGDFVEKYRSLLSRTGEARPADLAAEFGFDIRQPNFWQNSLEVIQRRIDRYLEL